jgi:hypothetical protein
MKTTGKLARGARNKVRVHHSKLEKVYKKKFAIH